MRKIVRVHIVYSWNCPHCGELDLREHYSSLDKLEEGEIMGCVNCGEEFIVTYSCERGSLDLFSSV